jgi:von Willebrand factor type A domain
MLVALAAVALVALALRFLTPFVPAAAGAAADQLDLVAVVRSDEEVSVAVDVVRSAPSGPPPPQSFSVTVGGAAQPARTRPVMSDKLAVAVVVDASEQGGKALQAGLSGAANFILGAPLTTRAALVADSSQPTVLVPLGTGATELLGELDRVYPGGGRNTPQAVNLAIGQLPTGPDDSRVVLLYTSAPDAGGEPPSALAERLNRANALLAVITTAPDTRYWTQVTSATGGLLVSDPGTLTAFDLVDTTLRNRYLVSFPVPARLPAQVTVRVDTGQGTLTASGVVPADEAAAPQPATPARGWSFWPLLLAFAALLATAAGAAIAFRSRARTAEPAAAASLAVRYQPPPLAPAPPVAAPPTPNPPTPAPPTPAPPDAAPPTPAPPAAAPPEPLEAARMADDNALAQQLAVWQAWARQPERGSGVDPLAALAANQQLTSLLAGSQFHAIQAARAAGATWQQIAKVLDVTPDQARADYRSDVEHFQREAPFADTSAYRAALD